MESEWNKLSTLAVFGAAAAAIGVFLIVAANSIVTDAAGSIGDYNEIASRVELAHDMWLWGEIAIGAGVFLVALSVMNKESSGLRVMKERLEKDFYRKCPGCGSWNTKFVPTCSTCGVSLPPLSEFQKTGGTSSTSREGPL